MTENPQTLVFPLGSPLVVAAADGIGGQPGGEVASALTVRQLAALGPSLGSEEAVRDAVNLCNHAVYAAAERDPELTTMGQHGRRAPCRRPPAGVPMSAMARCPTRPASGLRRGERGPAPGCCCRGGGPPPACTRAPAWRGEWLRRRPPAPHDRAARRGRPLPGVHRRSDRSLSRRTCSTNCCGCTPAAGPPSSCGSRRSRRAAPTTSRWRCSPSGSREGGTGRRGDGARPGGPGTGPRAGPERPPGGTGPVARDGTPPRHPLGITPPRMSRQPDGRWRLAQQPLQHDDLRPPHPSADPLRRSRRRHPGRGLPGGPCPGLRHHRTRPHLGRVRRARPCPAGVRRAARTARLPRPGRPAAQTRRVPGPQRAARGAARGRC